MKSLSEGQNIRKNWLVHGRVIVGILLVAISQYNLLRLGPIPFFPGPTLFSVPLSNDVFGLEVIDTADTLANCLLLLIGSVLLVSVLSNTDAFSAKKAPSLLSKDIPGFSRGRLILIRVFGFGLVFYLIWQLYQQSEEPALLGVWLVTIMIFGYLVARMDFQNGVFLGPSLRRSDVAWLAGLFLLGLVVSMYRLQSLPNQFMGDEGSFWDLASSFASGTLRPLFFDNGVYSFPNMSSVGQAAVLMIFGISLWSWRFSSVLAGLLTIIPLYLLARELFDRQVAVVSCVLMVTLEYFLAFSRLGYNNSQALFPVTLALYFVVIGVRRSSLLYFYLAGCAAGLGFYTYPASRSALVIIVLFMLTLLIQNRKTTTSVFKAILVIGLAWCIVTTPLLVFSSLHSPDSVSLKLRENVFFRTDFASLLYPHTEFLNDPATILSADRSFFFNPSVYAWLLTRGFVRTLLSFEVAGLKIGHFITTPLAGFGGAIFFTIGMVISLARFWEQRYYLLLYWFAVNIFLLSTFNTAPPPIPHLVSVIPLIALWTGLGLVSTITGLSQLYLRNRKIGAILIFTATVGIALTGLYSYFVRMPALYQPEPEQIMSWTGLYAQDEKIIYVYDKPEQSQLKPYVMQFIRPDFPYIAVAPNQLPGELGGKTVVFFPPTIAPQVESILHSTWPEIPAQKTFYNFQGTTTLEGRANFHTDFGAAPGLAASLLDSYLRPGLWLILLTTSCLVFAIGFRASWLKHTPQWVHKAYAWTTAEPPEA